MENWRGGFVLQCPMVSNATLDMRSDLSSRRLWPEPCWDCSRQRRRRWWPLHGTRILCLRPSPTPSRSLQLSASRSPSPNRLQDVSSRPDNLHGRVRISRSSTSIYTSSSSSSRTYRLTWHLGHGTQITKRKIKLMGRIWIIKNLNKRRITKQNFTEAARCRQRNVSCCLGSSGQR